MLNDNFSFSMVIASSEPVAEGANTPKFLSYVSFTNAVSKESVVVFCSITSSFSSRTTVVLFSSFGVSVSTTGGNIAL